MSIEATLERIAVELTEIRKTLQQTVNPVVSAQPQSGPPLPATGSAPGNVPTPGPATVSTGPSPVAVGGPPVGAPTMQGGGVPTTTPPMVAPGAGVPTPMTTPASGAPAQTAQATSPPAPQVQGVPTLDDIKALANDFHRAHPERAHEFVQVLANKNAQKLSELPPASYPEVHGALKKMMEDY